MNLSKMTESDWEKLHWAVGLLLGIGHKVGVLDVNIYHNEYRIQITRVPYPNDVIPTKTRGEHDN